MIYRLGLIGHPVAHSLSPPMHLAALKHCGLEGEYNLIDIEPAHLDERLAELLKDGLQGLNVTIPHKGGALRLSTRQSPEALATGAANTLRFEGNEITAHNTDVEGFTNALLISWPVKAIWDDAIILGGGGAARAAIAALLQLGVKTIHVLVRDLNRAKDLPCDLSKRLGDQTILDKVHVGEINDCSLRAKLIVNCAPLGQSGNAIPQAVSDLLRAMDKPLLMFDMVYSRTAAPTPLLALCESLGINAVDGKAMLVEQAALSFQFWTGKTVPREVMYEALQDAL